MKETRISFYCLLAHSIEIDSRGTYKSRTSNFTVRQNLKSKQTILFYVILRRATNFIYETKRDKNVSGIKERE